MGCLFSFLGFLIGGFFLGWPGAIGGALLGSLIDNGGIRKVKKQQHYYQANQRCRDQRKYNARKKHSLEMKPLLMVCLIHMLCALKPKCFNVGKENPVYEKSVIRPYPDH